MEEYGLSSGYADVLGLCKAESFSNIADSDWSLNPGRYVGADLGEQEDIDFIERLEFLAEQLDVLGREAQELHENVLRNSVSLIEEIR